jgi:hypothetical protein
LREDKRLKEVEEKLARNKLIDFIIHQCAVSLSFSVYISVKTRLDWQLKQTTVRKCEAALEFAKVAEPDSVDEAKRDLENAKVAFHDADVYLQEIEREERARERGERARERGERARERGRKGDLLREELLELESKLKAAETHVKELETRGASADDDDDYDDDVALAIAKALYKDYEKSAIIALKRLEELWDK